MASRDTKRIAFRPTMCASRMAVCSFEALLVRSATASLTSLIRWLELQAGE
jgi:hypothetical protein